MVNVEGKWALITGASRGIGYLSAIFMAEQGCDLVLHSRNAENSKKVLSEVLAKGVKAYTVSAELSDANQVEKMLLEIDAKGTQIDIVLNNAGLQIAYRTEYFKTPVSDYVESYKINTIAPAMICYHFIPKMIERGFGRVVNTTSGIRLEPEQAGYSASKAALDKISIDLGSKLNGTDVTINLADPGWCRTDLGGPKAPNSPESAIPGVLVGAFIDDKKSGRIFSAQDYCGMSLRDAVAKAEKCNAPY
ncbi:MAG TPA: SDR family oxidoreductase [Paludibacteraceae bacterium]|jgi:short-subunit dehydrogenase|nr:SDR family oxidoreductase [Paludibacteraceae bacterium]HOU67075.1 SDR family oxidoreductase [Paludibacteraceae bacterium]HQF49247.1 SDR family oxidoreductase [Paludibacteraceae bacterium]HQJ91216.1 SDR family oxidoreductase [Paludibacteraceae bacterium]